MVKRIKELTNLPGINVCGSSKPHFGDFGGRGVGGGVGGLILQQKTSVLKNIFKKQKKKIGFNIFFTCSTQRRLKESTNVN
jgi:hypothetical protein